MAYEIPGFSFTLIAAGTLTQFTAVDVEASTGRAIAPSAGGRMIGVVQNKPTVGKSATIVCSGVTKGKIGTGGVTAGNSVMVNASGEFVVATGTNRAIGIALKTNASGTLGTILLGNNAGWII